MHSRVFSLALAAALGVAAASQSTAAFAKPVHAPKVQQVTATFQGVVGAGAVDTLGEFGGFGDDLSGMTFTASFVANERQPSSLINTPTLSFYSGPVQASLTIDGTTVVVAGATGLSRVGEQTTPGISYFGSAFQVVQLTTSERMSTHFVMDIDTPLSFGSTADYHSYPLNGAVWTSIPTGPGFDFSGDFSISASPLALFSEDIQLVPDTLTVTATPAPALSSVAVPEPATWAMLLLGLGGLGAAARCRRERRATA